MTYLASLDIFHVWLAMFSVSVFRRGSEQKEREKEEKINRPQKYDVTLFLTVPLRTLHIYQVRKTKL